MTTVSIVIAVMTKTQKAASARGWNDLHDIWMYISTDFRWIIALFVISGLVTVFESSRVSRNR